MADMGKHRRLADEVSAAITFFEHLMTFEAPTSIEALSKARVTLVQAVNAYIAYLGTQVSGSQGDARLAPWKEAYGRAVELRRSYSEHIARFAGSAMVADWPTYRSSCLCLIRGMREHLKEVTAWKQLD